MEILSLLLEQLKFLLTTVKYLKIINLLKSQTSLQNKFNLLRIMSKHSQSAENKDIELASL